MDTVTKMLVKKIAEKLDKDELFSKEIREALENARVRRPLEIEKHEEITKPKSFSEKEWSEFLQRFDTDETFKEAVFEATKNYFGRDENYQKSMDRDVIAVSLGMEEREEVKENMKRIREILK